jgi:adenylate kinase family enzyme
MTLKNNLMTEVRKGMVGKNGTIPFPVDKLDEYIEIAKNTNYLFVGDTGSGKSTLAQDLILNILDWYYEHQSDDLKLSVIYFGMERKQYMYSAKWVSRMIFHKTGKLIPVKKILGRKRKKDARGKLTKEFDVLTPEEFKLVDDFATIFDVWEQDEVFACIEGTRSATWISKYIQNFAKRHGEVVKPPKTEEHPLPEPYYVPHHDNHIVLIATDYVGILDGEKDEQSGQKKQKLDKYSEAQRKARDFYGFSPLNIQQLGRAISGTDRLKLNDVKPKLSDIADTSDLARDADVAVAIFDPFRYLQEGATTDLLGYKLPLLRDDKGVKFYRSLHILKNSFDAEGITIGAAFYPFTGSIKAMPKPKQDMTDQDYEGIRNGSYFLL